MSRKKLLCFLLVAIMVVSFVTACGSKKTSKEALQQTLMKSKGVDSSSFKIEALVKLDVSNSSNPELQSLMGMMNNIKITLTGSTDNKSQRAAMEGTLDFGGMAFNGNIYTYDNKVALQIPFLYPGYIVIDPEELSQGQELPENLDYEAVKPIYNNLTKSILKNLDDSVVIEHGNKTIEIGKEKVKTTEFELNFGERELRVVAKAFVELLKDENARALLVDMIIGYDPYMTKSDVELALDEILSSSEQMIDEILMELKKVVDFKDGIKVKLFVDDKANIVKTSSGISLSIIDGMDKIDATFNIDVETWDINKVGNIEIPDINDQNSIGLEDLLYGTIFNMFNY